MGSKKLKKPFSKNPNSRKRPLGPRKSDKKKKKKQRITKKDNRNHHSNEKSTNDTNTITTLHDENDNLNVENDNGKNQVLPSTTSNQLKYFVEHFQSANGVLLSSIELESLKDRCIVDLSQSIDQDAGNLGKDIKAAFGPSWKKTLCEKELVEGKIDPGSPAVLIISTSAMRAIELLRGFRSLTKECHPVKLFAKHMKVEEQVSLLKNRVNIASGTPARIKKLIDIEALGLSRLAVVLLDIHPDVKCYTLFSLPQVSDDFWDLYKNYLHQPLLQGALRLCLYGPLSYGSKSKRKKKSSKKKKTEVEEEEEDPSLEA